MYISVIMSVYDETQVELSRSIESILKQSFKEFEFIILLDNPNNKKAEKIIKVYQEKDKRIVFLKNKKNLWTSKSANIMIKKAIWKYIARMDADDFSYKNRLEKQLNFMNINNNVDVLFSNIEYIDEKNKTYNTSFSKESHFHNQFFLENCFIHPTLFAKRKVLLKCNYISKYGSASEDIALYFKLYTSKYILQVMEDILLKVVYKKSDRELRYYVENKFQRSKNINILIFKYFFVFYKSKWFLRFLIKQLSFFIRDGLILIFYKIRIYGFMKNIYLKIKK